MKTKIKQLLFVLFLLSLMLPANSVLADVGPKPSVDFTFSGLGNRTITTGILYECDQLDCSDAQPLKELGPQRLVCQPTSCSAIAYGFAPYHKLEITLSDGQTLTSNVFQTAGFNSTYTVTVRENDLLVEARLDLFSSPTYILYILCACACIGVIGLAGVIVFFIRRSKKK